MLNSLCSDKVISAIYESVDASVSWEVALEELRVAMGANSLTLRMSQRKPRPGEVLHAVGPIVTPGSVLEWEARLLGENLPQMSNLGSLVLVDWQSLPRTDAVKSLLQKDVFKTATLCFDIFDNTTLGLSASRGSENVNFSEQDFDLLKVAGRHFSRAIRMRQKFTRTAIVEGFQSEALDRMVTGGILIGQDRGMITLNKTADNIIADKDGLYVAAGHLHATDPQCDRHLQSVMRSVLAKSETEKSFALSLRRDTNRRDWGVVVSPRNSPSLITGRSERCALVFIRDSTPSTVLDIDLMQQLFSFTRAEANLAIGMAKGKRFEEIEAELNIRHNTVRAHLRSMFAKTEVKRQVELVHLLTNSLASLGHHNEFDFVKAA